MFIIFLSSMWAWHVHTVHDEGGRGWIESVRAIWPALINCLFVFVTGEN